MTAEPLGDGPGHPQAAALPPSVRDEHQALKRTLRITIGGERVDLRTLDLDESDAWIAELTAKMAALELPTGTEGGDTLASLMTAPAIVAAELVAAYDRAGVLGGLEALRKRASKRELKAAVDAMVEAEDPFGEDVARLVATGFGAPSRFLAAGMRVLLAEVGSLHQAPSTSGPSAATASATPSSAGRGAASSSSSAGTTARRRTKRS